MAKAVWKYEMVFNAGLVTRVPSGAQFLTVQLQDGAPMLWALVDTDPKAETEAVLIHLLPTGYALPQESPMHYIGTVQVPVPPEMASTPNQTFVFHAFWSNL